MAISGSRSPAAVLTPNACGMTLQTPIEAGCNSVDQWKIPTAILCSIGLQEELQVRCGLTVIIRLSDCSATGAKDLNSRRNSLLNTMTLLDNGHKNRHANE
jgi:hypothetical protein